MYIKHFRTIGEGCPLASDEWLILGRREKKVGLERRTEGV